MNYSRNRDIDGEFDEFFNSTLLQTLHDVEIERKSLKSKILNEIAVIGIILVITLFISVLKSTIDIKVFIIGLILAAIYWRFRFSERIKNYKREYKIKLIGSILKFIDGSLFYEPDEYITEEQFIESKIFRTNIDKYEGSDYVRGMINYTAVEFSQVHAQYKTKTYHTDSDGRTRTEERWHTIFKGIFFIADFNKYFNTQVVVLPDRSSWFTKSLKKKFAHLMGWKVIELEDHEFSKYFIVLGEDHIEARYILSTSLVRRIMNLRKKVGTDIYLSFVNSKIHIAIPTDTLFEPSIFFGRVDYETIRSYFSFLNLVYGIVEDLDLNTRIWSKQPLIPDKSPL